MVFKFLFSMVHLVLDGWTAPIIACPGSLQRKHFPAARSSDRSFSLSSDLGWSDLGVLCRELLLLFVVARFELSLYEDLLEYDLFLFLDLFENLDCSRGGGRESLRGVV